MEKKMSEEIYEQTSSCGGDCSGCSSNCSSRQPSREEFLVPLNQYSKVKKVIGVVSGKGGVGKSFVTSRLAALMQNKGYQAAVLDADITGPSIPKAFGIHEQAKAGEAGILPVVTKHGLKLISVNVLLEDEETPVVWRGPIIAGTVKQFWSDVVWGNVDYMFVDMPPGTGDVPLTVFQSLPVDGVIIVTSPQELVSMIVKKAVHMANAMEIPVLGIVENYSYVECGHCGEKISVFGESKIEEIAAQYGFPVLAKIPLDPRISGSMDTGLVEELTGEWLNETADFLEKLLPVQTTELENIRIAVTTDEANNVFQHFGHCEKFTVYEIKSGELAEKFELDTEGNGHEALAGVMKKNKIQVLLCGGIGLGAMQALMEAGILVVPGMKGDIDVAVASYLDGSVQASTEPNCDHHQEGEAHSCSGGGCHSEAGGCSCGGC